MSKSDDYLEKLVSLYKKLWFRDCTQYLSPAEEDRLENLKDELLRELTPLLDEIIDKLFSRGYNIHLGRITLTYHLDREKHREEEVRAFAEEMMFLVLPACREPGKAERYLSQRLPQYICRRFKLDDEPDDLDDEPEEEQTLRQLFAADADGEEDEARQQQIEQCLGFLTEMEYDLLHLYYVESRSLTTLASVYGMSPNRMRQMKNNALASYQQVRRSLDEGADADTLFTKGTLERGHSGSFEETLRAYNEVERFTLSHFDHPEELALSDEDALLYYHILSNDELRSEFSLKLLPSVLSALEQYLQGKDLLYEEKIVIEKKPGLLQRIGIMRVSKTLEVLGEAPPDAGKVTRNLTPEMEFVLTPGEVKAIKAHLGLEIFLCSKSRYQRLRDSAFSWVDRVSAADALPLDDLCTPGALQRSLPEYGPRLLQRTFAALQDFAAINIRHPQDLITNEDALLYYRLVRSLLPPEEASEYIFKEPGKKTLEALSHYLYRKRLIDKPYQIPKGPSPTASLTALELTNTMIIRFLPLLREETQNLVIDLYDKKIDYLYEHDTRVPIARQDLRDLYWMLAHIQPRKTTACCPRGLFLTLTHDSSMHERVRSSLYSRIAAFARRNNPSHKGPPMDWQVKECLRQTIYAQQNDPNTFVQGGLYVHVMGMYLKKKRQHRLPPASSSECAEVRESLAPLIHLSSRQGEEEASDKDPATTQIPAK